MMKFLCIFAFLLAAVAADNVCTSLDECPEMLLLQMEAKTVMNGTAPSVSADESTWKDRLAPLLLGKRTRRGKKGHALLAYFRKRGRFEITESRQPSNFTNTSTEVGDTAVEDLEEEVLDLFTTVFMNLMDCLWLFPFLASKIYWKYNCVVYVVIQTIFAVVSVLLAFLEVGLAKDASGRGSSSGVLLDILAYAPPTLLTVITLFLYLTHVEVSHKDSADAHAEEDAQAFSTSIFAVILSLSNLDNFAVYVPIIYGEVATPMVLTAGVALCSVLVMMVCLLFSENAWLVYKCEQIPPWAVCTIIAAGSWIEIIL